MYAWDSHSFDISKINCDVSILYHDNAVAFGCIFGDSSSKFTKGCSAGISFAIILRYELFAIWRDVLQWHWSASITLIQRTANRAADLKAKETASL
ncbi:hypothetical protein PIB30_015306 [Stylosanthes scabra]|uniref:RNase H type-1 domain-containing protein n=1 Tax=Stylosanthes scabra TaxID=79078 RepID=A0ABU6Z7G6_9FABA|nr:hypothetical protein [Stylosanthes scabra]